MFALEGATVALLGGRKARLDETAAEIARPRRARVMAPVDVGDREQVDQVATQLLADLRRVDILMNDAGPNVLGNARRMEHLTPEDWDHVIRVAGPPGDLPVGERSRSTRCRCHAAPGAARRPHRAPPTGARTGDIERPGAVTDAPTAA